MNSIEQLDTADDWMGEGMELARRVLAYAEQLDAEMVDSATKSDIASDQRAVIKRGFNPLEQPR